MWFQTTSAVVLLITVVIGNSHAYLGNSFPYSISNATLFGGRRLTGSQYRAPSLSHHHYSSENGHYCGLNCLNDGQCILNPNTYKPYCRCPTKYVGTKCEYQNPCYGNNRCFNGGTCQPIIASDQPPSFKCLCPLGFSASMCEVEEPNICQRERPCRNGARCVLHGDLEHYECQCQPGWRGELCDERDNCASSPCRNGARCLSHTNGTGGGYTCECSSGFRGKTCTEDVNECTELGDSRACNQRGTCINVPGSYVCNCEPGYTGARCETVYIPCQTDNPCQNGGDCIADHQAKTYRCSCPVGFTGRDCETNIDDCGGHLCQNGGTCLDGINTYTCHCPGNFTGPYCSQDVDECSRVPQPCQNGATCANTVGGFNCICVNGWTGPTCSENIDDCADAPCLNGATCHDRVGAYYCQCPPGKTGLLCHLEDACASNPCHAGAICDTNPVDGTYRCSCPPGYQGTDCMEDINECQERGSPCEHGGTCVNTPGSYRCDCAIGFTGARCEVNINECDSNPCQNEGTCLDERGSYRCVCMPGYTGIHCETNIDECQSNPCQNNAICTDLINGYRCLCMIGFDGMNCEKMADQCYKNPCKNNGTCHNEIQLPNSKMDTSTCTCQEGFKGRYCEININDCESNPCLFGKCVDMINSFKCICNPGYSGILCQNQINECESNPCKNGGTCVDGLSNYHCECPNGTYGVNCQYQDNECWSNPCLNGGTCHDKTGKYLCQCAAGFRGEQCEMAIDQCQSNPCANGAVCYTTGPNSYQCKCAKGFYGPRCMSLRNECLPNPCQNGGFCEEDVDKFICRCPPGYTGYRCETPIDPCRTVRCENGGTCFNLPGYSYQTYQPTPAFQCRCNPGYSGPYCESKITTIDDQKRRQAWARCQHADFCYEHFSDNVCNEECNNRDCFFDGFDCRGMEGRDSSGGTSITMVKNHPVDRCDYDPHCEDSYANGHCDYGCNRAECAWDGLDCEADPASTDYLRGELIIDINYPFHQINTSASSDGLAIDTRLPASVKKLIRMLSILISSVLRVREIRPNEYGGTKLIMAIDNRKCLVTGRCFEDSHQVALFLLVSQNRTTSPVKEYLRKSGIQMSFKESDIRIESPNLEEKFLIPGQQAHNLTYIVIGLMTLLFVGILLGALVSNNRKRVARGITWFPEGFFTSQMGPISRSGTRHHHNASAAAACGDFSRSRRIGLSHSNSIRSGCPDGQEMRQFKSPRDDLLADEKAGGGGGAAIYEEPSECRSWSSAHYEAFQPIHESMTPPLPTPSLDAIGPNGMTPLMVAAAFPNLMNMDNPDMLCDSNNAVQDLLSNGANVSLTCDKTNETCLHLAARYARADAAKRLIDAGADCDAQDATGRTPLHAAIAADARGVFEILLRNRTVNLNAKTLDGTTPLILSARMANEGMLETLVQHHCDLNLTDETGKTALHWAASVNNVEAVRVLLQHGADRDARNHREETPLFLAAREGAYQCAKLLLDYHANRDITDNMDQLPRDVAMARMHTDIVELLDKHEPSALPPPIQPVQVHNSNSNSSSNSSHSNSGAPANRAMMVTSPPVPAATPTTWGTLGRSTAPRRKPQQPGGNQAHHQSNLNLNASGVAAGGTLTKTKTTPNINVSVDYQQQHQSFQPSNAPPPPPPPRNCVALYNRATPNPPLQPILLLGSGAPTTATEMGLMSGSMHHHQSSNLTTIGHAHQGSQSGAALSPPFYGDYHHQSPPSTSMLAAATQSSAMISPPSRPPPTYDDCFKQQQQHQGSQPITAVAPRHPQQQQQPPTPTATTAPAALGAGFPNNNAQMQKMQMQHARPLDSYPTPSPDSWGSLSTSSPMSAQDWNTAAAVGVTTTGTTMVDGGQLINAAGLTMLASPVYSATNQQPPQQTYTTNNSYSIQQQQQPTQHQQQQPQPQSQPRFQPSSTQQAVFI